MPKINVYLPDELAAAVKEAGIPVSSVCQQALADAVLAATGHPGTTGAPMSDESTPAWSRFTARARTAVQMARAQAEADGRAPTAVDLLAAVVEEGDNLALTVLAAIGVEPPDLLIEARGLAGRPGATAPGDLLTVLERSLEEALRLGHNFIGCEHLLLGLAAGPETDPLVVALRATGVDAAAARAAVGAAVAGVAFARTRQAASGLSTPVRTILEDIRQRLSRLERGSHAS